MNFSDRATLREEKTELVICRGIPASGKTTWARQWVAVDPASRARVNKDDLRRSLHNGVYLGVETEQQINWCRDRMIETLLRAGVSVVSDDTNLPQDVARRIARIGRAVGVDVREVLFTTVSVDECVARDHSRDNGVGEEVIRGMFDRFLAGGRTLAPVPDDDSPVDVFELYEPNPDLPDAWLVDIDGTLATMSGRSPFEWHRVGEDAIVPIVQRAVNALRHDHRIVVMSGRDEVCRSETKKWLNAHAVPFDALVMRPAGDHRKDAIVKYELFRDHVAPFYRVVGVLDDRDQVVAMWRKIGLPCFQVAPGAF